MLPFLPLLVRGQDMTWMEFSAVDRIRAEVTALPPGSVVVVQDGDLCRVLCLALEATTEHPVFRESTFDALTADDFYGDRPAVLITTAELPDVKRRFEVTSPRQLADYIGGAHRRRLLNLLAPRPDQAWTVFIYQLDNV
jgi:hypothetical protein